MKTRFNFAGNMRQKFKDMMFRGSLCEIILAISMVYALFIFMIPLTDVLDIDMEWRIYSQDIDRDTWNVFAFISLIWVSVCSVFAKSGKTSGNLTQWVISCQISSGIPLGLAIMFISFSEADFRVISIVYLVISVVVEIYIYTHLKQKEQAAEVLLNRVSGDYILLKKNGVSGSMSARALYGCNKEFFLRYDEIKNVYVKNYSPNSEQYFNFCIEHNCGALITLVIDDAQLAASTIEKIKSGEIRLEEGSEICPNPADRNSDSTVICPMCHKAQSSYRSTCIECGHIFDKARSDYRKRENSLGTSYKNTDGTITCPVCKRTQNGDRTVCYECGQKFTNVSSYSSSEEQKPSNVPVKVYVDTWGMMECPICKTRQNDEQTVCIKCGQVFMNNQIAPYWCGKCGKEGPYFGDCPDCGSSVKLYNN